MYMQLGLHLLVNINPGNDLAELIQREGIGLRIVGKAVLFFDCDYNRTTTVGKELFINDGEELQQLIVTLDKSVAEKIGHVMP